MCPESVTLLRGLAALRTTALSSFFVVLVAAQSASAQTTELSGVIQDSSHASLQNAAITATSDDTGVKWTTTSNHEGYYNLPFLKAGSYAITVEAAGFQAVSKHDEILEAGQRRRVDFVLEPAPFTQAVTVERRTPSVRSESAGVSTTISRQFVENLPLNGRTLQPLLAIVPGITPTNSDGQFSTNGQRDNANYFTVDGVSANVGLSSFRNLGETGSGSIPAFNVLGGTQNLATLDALHEITVQTSSYSAEFGRTAGAQVQVVTRSGTNRFRGTAFEYFRDDALDANDWFANLKGVPKPSYRQHEAGGVLGGPIVRNRTFFLLSYEGLRLTQPQVSVVDVPTQTARQLASASIRPLLDAFPLPNGPENTITMLGQFAAAYSDAGAADTTSVRVDHVVRDGFTLFGRYSDGRSELSSRADSLTHVISDHVNTRSLTAGGTLVLTPTIVSEFRANYSTNQSKHTNTADDFGGATLPPDSLLFPTPFASPDSSRFIFQFGPSGAGGPRLVVGRSSDHRVQQVNLVDKVSVIKGSNAFRFGVDFLHQSLAFGPQDYGLGINFNTVPEAVSGSTPSVLITTFDPMVLAFTNIAAFALDQWRPNRRLTLDMGMRWELSPAPHATDGQELYTLIGFGDPTALRLAPPGTPLYSTTHANFAPRVGVSYQLSDVSRRERVLRGGFGVFYDLGRGGIAQATESFPHSRRKGPSAEPFPFGPEVLAPLSLSSLDPPYSRQSFLAFAPDHVLPRTYEWNVTLDQMIGGQRTLSVSYVGAAGRDLLRRVQMLGPPPNFVDGSTIDLTTNSATSDYRAIQLAFQSRFAHGLQAMGSYTLADSTDNASSDVMLQSPASVADPDRDRGPSDFDVRHSVQGALTYTIPAARFKGVAAALLQDWSIDSTFLVRTATPVNVTIMRQLGVDFVTARPDPVPSEPRYIEDPTVAGGLRFNPAAFVVPTEERQGFLGRNALRGLGLAQVDFGVRRTLHLARGSTVQVKAEFFNLFNHPNFGNPDGFLGKYVPPLLSNSTFGVSTTMAAKAPITGVTTGLSSLYRAGGPRSIQLSLRVGF